MGEFDFTYELPENFQRRVVQYLQQTGSAKVAEAFLRCRYEYDVLGFAYYEGIRGDNWNKKAVDFTIEGKRGDIAILRGAERALNSAIDKAIRANESGFLVKTIYYLESDEMATLQDLPSSNRERLAADIETAKQVLNDLTKIGGRVCLNCSFSAVSSENSINDSFRDMLSVMGYDEVKDQTRHGISVGGKDAGEVDILLTKNGKEIAIFEGLKLSNVNAAYIDEHIEKAIINYNALGTATFIVAYVSSPDFDAFWSRYYAHIRDYTFPLEIAKGLSELPYPNAATRIASLILSRDRYEFPVYFLALKIC